MAAEKGNQYALGNNGGRPLIYDHENPEDIKKVAELCESYFEYIKGEYKDIPLKEDETESDQRSIQVRPPENPTITGLTLYIGFESKSTLYDYEKKEVFSFPIKRAITKIENFHEQRAADGDKCVGNIFILKNFGWKDSQQIDHTTNGKSVNRPKVKFVSKQRPEAPETNE